MMMMMSSVILTLEKLKQDNSESETIWDIQRASVSKRKIGRREGEIKQQRNRRTSVKSCM